MAYNLAEAVTVLAGSGDGDEPASLSSVQFSEVSLAETQARQAVGKSGAMVYTRLPTYGGVDLETFCPGSATNVFITSDADRVPAPTDAPQDDDISGAAGFPLQRLGGCGWCSLVDPASVNAESLVPLCPNDMHESIHPPCVKYISHY